MLSNVSELTSKVTDTSAAKLLAKDARCWFYRKRSLLPIELREEVERITGG
jgi:hypothetical protein